MDAGCKKKRWFFSTGEVNAYYPRYEGQGRLLASTVCIDKEYTKNVAPHIGHTRVYTIIEDVKIRSVDSIDGTMAVDLAISMIWQDPRINVRLSENGIPIILSEDGVREIWTPDLYIMDRKFFKLESEWISLKKAIVLRPERIQHLDLPPSISNQTYQAIIETKYEIKCTVHCPFSHSNYPMDIQTCNLSLGSGSFGAVFVLQDQHNKLSNIASQMTNRFTMKFNKFDRKTDHGNNTIGISVKMDRNIKPFLLKYYIPCIAIALVSQLSFIIPVTAIPGRVSLLVTLFLTLINLFIHQMVRIIYFLDSSILTVH